MKYLLIAFSIVCTVIGVDLPPCPDDPVCPETPDIWYPAEDPYDDPNAVLQYVDQYDCSNVNLKKRGLMCFGSLPNVLSPKQREVIIGHGKTLGYYDQFLNAASDERLKLINTEFDKYWKYFNKNFKKGSPEQNNFVIYYRSIRKIMVDFDVSTLDFETARDKALAKMQIGTKISQDLQGIVSTYAFFLVPEQQLTQMGQVSFQILKQQPYSRLLFLNIVDTRKRLFFSSLLDDAFQYIQRALTKLKNGHPCQFLPCSDPKQFPLVIQMFENVLNHQRFSIFERPVPKVPLIGYATRNLKEKGIIGLTNQFYTIPYESQIRALIHETTHLYGTSDHQYGKAKCLALLKNAPLDSMNNADSFAYEIINIGRDKCNIKSPHPLQ